MRVLAATLTCLTAIGIAGFSAAQPALAFDPAPGSLDTSFNKTGMVETSLGDRVSSNGHSVAVQKDGKIIVVGPTYGPSNPQGNSFGILRYLPDGGLDPSFGKGGQVVTTFGSNDVPMDVAIQPDGRIIAGGSSNYTFALTRYLPDGDLDPSFGDGGKVLTPFDHQNNDLRRITLTSDGKILAAGRTFGNSGSSFMLARYLPNGALDEGFGNHGCVITSEVSGIGWKALELPNKDIVVAGNNNLQFVMVGYLPNGDIDKNFGDSGVVKNTVGVSSSGLTAALQSDGKIIVGGFARLQAGGSFSFAMMRYADDGKIDSTFGDNGLATASFGAMDVALAVAVDKQDRIILAGYTDAVFAVARFTPQGILDPSFGKEGKVTTAFGLNNQGWGIALQEDGKIVVAGFKWAPNGFYSRFILARYWA